MTGTEQIVLILICVLGTAFGVLLYWGMLQSDQADR